MTHAEIAEQLEKLAAEITQAEKNGMEMVLTDSDVPMLKQAASLLRSAEQRVPPSGKRDNYCEYCGYTESHDPLCTRPPSEESAAAKELRDRTQPSSAVEPVYGGPYDDADMQCKWRLVPEIPTSSMLQHPTWLAIWNQMLAAAPSAVEQDAARYSAPQAEAIIACRDALLERDYSEAWHQLYQLQAQQPHYDPFNPWIHLEAEVAAMKKGAP